MPIMSVVSLFLSLSLCVSLPLSLSVFFSLFLSVGALVLVLVLEAPVLDCMRSSASAPRQAEIFRHLYLTFIFDIYI